MSDSPPQSPSSTSQSGSTLECPEVFFKNKRVLITGGAGFIGSALCSRMQALDARVSVVDLCPPSACIDARTLEWRQGDCADPQLLANITPGCDVVFSLAGRCGHWQSMIDPLGDMAANTTAPLALLEACRQWAPSAHVIYAGTRQVYGRSLSLPVKECHPMAPVDMNGIHKMASELHHFLYHKHHAIRTTVLRLTNTYGPGMRVGGPGQTFLGEWLLRLQLGRDLVVFGKGSQLRDLNYVDDVVEAFVRVACAPALVDGAVFNLGGQEAIPLGELAQLLLRISGADLKIRREPFPVGLAGIDIGDYWGDFRAIENRLGWVPQIGLEEGLRRTLEKLGAAFSKTPRGGVDGD